MKTQSINNSDRVILLSAVRTAQAAIQRVVKNAPTLTPQDAIALWDAHVKLKDAIEAVK